MDNIVYLVSTEYQLILSLGIINHYHPKNYNNVIVRISPKGGTRLNNLHFQDTGIDYREIIYDYSNPPKSLKNDLDDLLGLKPAKLYFFLENKFWLNYLFSELKKNNTSIVLGPDGMKVYVNYSYWTWKQRFKMLLEGLKYSFNTGMLSTWPFVEKTYATSKYIDEVWVEHPQYYDNITKKKVVEFKYTIDKDFVGLLMKVFAVNLKDFAIIKDKPTILFLDSSYNTKEYYERTSNILSALKNKYPGRELLVKYHPISHNDAKKVYSSIPGITELNSAYPAELYLASASDSIVISMVSTSELFYNSNCKYYWIYKLYSDMYNYDMLKNPTDYINVVSDINLIEE